MKTIVAFFGILVFLLSAYLIAFFFFQSEFARKRSTTTYPTPQVLTYGDLTNENNNQQTPIVISTPQKTPTLTNTYDEWLYAPPSGSMKPFQPQIAFLKILIWVLM